MLILSNDDDDDGDDDDNDVKDSTDDAVGYMRSMHLHIRNSVDEYSFLNLSL